MPDTPTAPASGGSAPASAGAPSAPSSTPAAATPPSGATPSAPAAGVTPSATPNPATPQDPATPGSAEPPQWRWQDILESTRKKVRAEAEREFRERYAPYDQFERDPWAAIQGWLSQAGQHSLYGPLVRDWASQYVQGQRQPETGPEPQPDVPIVDERGQVTGHAFSAARLKEWQEWNGKRYEQMLQQAVGPLQESLSQREQREQQEATARESFQWAQQTLGQLRALPYFKEHEEAIRAALEQHEEWGDNIHAAYNHVLVTEVLPKLGQAEQQKVISNLQAKAAAGTVPASGASPAGRPQFKTFREAAEYYDAHPEEAKLMANRER